MPAARKRPDLARTEVTAALAEGRRRSADKVGDGSGAVGGNSVVAGARVGRAELLGLQRAAGNAAVSALMAAKLRSPGGDAVGKLDAALREARTDEPAIDVVESGLKVAKDAGVPVELEGPKPPAAALAVTKTGFGPEAVPQKKPTPPPKPTPAVHPLGKAAAHPQRPAGGAAGTKGKGGTAGPPTAGATAAGGGATLATGGALSSDQLVQPPVPPQHVGPEQDPAFKAVTGSVKGFAAAKRAHPPAADKAKEAQDAAVAPTDDAAGQAKAAKVDTMDAQPVGGFDKKAFITAVKAAIEAKSPKTLKEADEYAESGKAGEVKGDLKGMVGQGKEGQAKDVEAATEAPPDTSKAVAKPVTPLAPEEQAGAPAIPAAGAVPKPAPPEQVNLQGGKHEAESQLAEGGVTEQQLATSNEPEFEQALADKKAAAAHADTAPAQYRAQEQQTIEQGKADAAAQTAQGVAGMQGSKAAALAALVAGRGKAKSKDETRRAEVTAKVQSIFAATEADVKKLLDGIDPKVDKAFEIGEAAARKAFESYVSAKMSAYKADRYSGWLGGLRWAKDKLVGMPSKVNEFYEAGRELYLKQMDGVISQVADIVGGDLAAAKKRIATGKAEISDYVKSLPKDLQKVGSEASSEIGERFSQLESDVDAKQEAVVDALATKYVESRKGLDERIEELQAENRGLVDKAVGAIKAVVNTIRGLVSMLTGVLAKAAHVIGDIVKDPIGFLGNLIAGVKGGILKFKDNILAHLKKGLFGWLFGALAEAGVEIPETFDIKGIIKLLASIFGLTWANIRNRLVKQVGAKAMDAIEKGVEIFQIIRGQGIAGLWEKLLEKLGNVKDMILEQVKDFVITKIITAGITWLIGLLNPAAAFIKACKLIYDVIMFFVTNGSRILKFVNTVLDSVADIVKGNVSSVVNKIDDVLGQMVPIIIGFLASAIGLGGIGEKIRSIIQTLQKPVNKALDFVIKQGLKLAGPLIRGIKGIAGKVKKKVAAGKALVKAKAAAVRAKTGELLGKLPAAFGFRGGGEAHRVYVDPATKRVMVASNPAEAGTVLTHMAAEVELLPDTNGRERTLKDRIRQHVQTARGRLARFTELLAGGRATEQKLSTAQYKLGQSMGPIFDAVHAHRLKQAGQVPPYTTEGGKTSQGTVTCMATIMVESAAGAVPYPTDGGTVPAGAIPSRSGLTRGGQPRMAHATETGGATGQVGTFVLENRPAAAQGEQRANIVTRSSGDESPETHAETRLLSQVHSMIQRDPTWPGQVRTFEVNLSHSPCPSCVRALLTLRELVDNENLRLTAVQWTKPYDKSFATYLDSLKGKYHRVRGPYPRD